MKVEHINPFIESTCEFFNTMLSAQVKRGSVGLAQSVGQPRHLLALIGISGSIRGMVAVSLPVETALKVVNRLLGSEIKVIDDTVKDAMSEMVNIIAGGAKARISHGNGNISNLSLPTIVNGSSFSVDYPSGSPWLEIQFESDLGPFSLRVTFERQS